MVNIQFDFRHSRCVHFFFSFLFPPSDSEALFSPTEALLVRSDLFPLSSIFLSLMLPLSAFLLSPFVSRCSHHPRVSMKCLLMPSIFRCWRRASGDTGGGRYE